MQPMSTRTILALAAAADVDPRTVKKALERGLAAVKGRPRERLAEAAPALGVTFPSNPPPSSGRAA
jgi:hypothetical protein